MPYLLAAVELPGLVAVLVILVAEIALMPATIVAVVIAKVVEVQLRVVLLFPVAIAAFVFVLVVHGDGCCLLLFDCCIAVLLNDGSIIVTMINIVHVVSRIGWTRSRRCQVCLFLLLEVAIVSIDFRINQLSIGIPPLISIVLQLLPSVSKSFDERIVVFSDNDRSVLFCSVPTLVSPKWQNAMGPVLLSLPCN